MLGEYIGGSSTIAERELEAARINIFDHAEKTRIFGDGAPRQLPVTIVTGFLGAGKTTLLNHVLTNRSNLRIAAAINDFAELNIDESLVRSKGTTSRIVELSNGCVCCKLLDDLQAAVWQLLKSGGDLDNDDVNYLIIETSGVADPVKVIRSLDAQFGKCYRARLDSVVTVVDADQLLASLDSPLGTAMTSQLRCADVLLLNKVDLIPAMGEEDPVARVEALVRSFNPDAKIIRTSRCRVPIGSILDVVEAPADSYKSKGGNAITHERSETPIFVSATGGSLRCAASDLQGGRKAPGASHLADDRLTSVAEAYTEGPLSLGALQHFVSRSGILKGVVRMKGVLWIAEIGLTRCILHLSGRGRLGFELDGPWAGPPRSELVFIGAALDADMIHAAFQQLRHPATPPPPAHALCSLQDFLSVQSAIFEAVQVADGADRGAGWFRLTGSGIYGYSVEEMESDLRMDIDALNMQFADAVNASADQPKAFVAYGQVRLEGGKSAISLCV